MAGLSSVAKEAGANPIRCPRCGMCFQSSAVLEALFAAILRRVKGGERVIVRGFGTFSAKVYKGRTIRTSVVKSGVVKFADSLVLRFRQSKVAKEYLNKPSELTRKKRNGD